MNSVCSINFVYQNTPIYEKPASPDTYVVSSLEQLTLAFSQIEVSLSESSSPHSGEREIPKHLVMEKVRRMVSSLLRGPEAPPASPISAKEPKVVTICYHPYATTDLEEESRLPATEITELAHFVAAHPSVKAVKMTKVPLEGSDCYGLREMLVGGHVVQVTYEQCQYYGDSAEQIVPIFAQADHTRSLQLRDLDRDSFEAFSRQLKNASCALHVEGNQIQAIKC